MMSNSLFRFYPTILLFIVFVAAAAFAQPPTGQPEDGDLDDYFSLADIAPADRFVSWIGRFSVQFPAEAQSSFESIDPKSDEPNKGASYEFTFKEAHFNLTYVDHTDQAFAALTPEQIEHTFSITVEALVKETGSIISDTKVLRGTAQGRLVKLRSAARQRVTMLGLISGNRLYIFVGATTGENVRIDALIDKAISSFKILTRAEVDRDINKKIASSTPKALPQTPVAQKGATDLQDQGLKGSVRSILEEEEDLSESRQDDKRYRSDVKEFNRRGDLVKEITFEPGGYPMQVEVWGYIDRSRVSRSEIVDGAAVISINSTPMDGDAPKRDTRYDFKHIYKYAGGRLIEHRYVDNNGQPGPYCTYALNGNDLIELCYDSENIQTSKGITKLDERNEVIEESAYDIGQPAKIESRYKYVYDAFDAAGNWIVRKQIKIESQDGKDIERPAVIQYRTIIYYAAAPRRTRR